MMMRALWVGGFCGLLSVGCSNAATGGDAGGRDGGTGTSPRSLLGTWDLTFTGSPSLVSTVTIGQDSLTVTSPSFLLTATRTGNALTFTDEQSLGNPNSNVVLTATQTPAAFNAGVLPFDLSGSWTMQIVPAGMSTIMTCTLTVSSTEIDGACQSVTSGGFFTFTTTKMAPAASILGDLGGTWINTWTWPGQNGGTFAYKLDFTGNNITTCPGKATVANSGSPVTGITFAYDGANTASGVAQGWAEYSATRR